MTIDFSNHRSWDNHPLTRIYLHIASNADQGFNCRQLMDYFYNTLGVARGERFQKQKIRGLALQVFTRLDSNRDGLVCITDLRNQLGRIRQAFAPLSHNSTVREAAKKRFRELCSDRHLKFFEIQEHVRALLPITLPFRGLVAQTTALILLEIAVPHALRSIRERYITEDQWVKTALSLWQ